MILAVASGKGGTGKTTVATSLARLLAERGWGVRLLDTDVEAPNCHLLLGVTPESRELVTVPVPEIAESACTVCGQCATACQFNALACVAGKVLLAAELCHGCGACVDACPEGAITERQRTIGEIGRCSVDRLQLIQGRLDVGQPVAVPVIRAVRRTMAPPAERVAMPENTTDGASLTIIDSPPGTSCPMVASVRGVDYLLLVTEPTPFGLHDLRLADQTAEQLGLPRGVVINRAGANETELRQFCRDRRLEVLAAIPDRRDIAEAYAAGRSPYDASPQFAAAIHQLLEALAPMLNQSDSSGGDSPEQVRHGVQADDGSATTPLSGAGGDG